MSRITGLSHLLVQALNQTSRERATTATDNTGCSFLTLFSNVIYFTTSLSDPGYIDHKNELLVEDIIGIDSIMYRCLSSSRAGFESDLTRAYNDGNRQYWMFFVFLTLFSNVLYFTTSLSDPGYIDHEDKQLTADGRIKDLSSKGDGDDSGKSSAGELICCRESSRTI